MDYASFTKSNYFKVKDPDAFKRFVASFSGTLCTQEKNGEVLHGFHVEDLVCDIPDENEGCVYVEEALAKHLEPQWVAVVEHVGREGTRYVAGHAYAVNSEGDITTVSLRDIYADAARMGKHVTDASY